MLRSFYLQFRSPKRLRWNLTCVCLCSFSCSPQETSEAPIEDSTLPLLQRVQLRPDQPEPEGAEQQKLLCRFEVPQPSAERKEWRDWTDAPHHPLNVQLPGQRQNSAELGLLDNSTFVGWQGEVQMVLRSELIAKTVRSMDGPKLNNVSKSERSVNGLVFHLVNPSPVIVTCNLMLGKRRLRRELRLHANPEPRAEFLSLPLFDLKDLRQISLRFHDGKNRDRVSFGLAAMDLVQRSESIGMPRWDVPELVQRNGRGRRAMVILPGQALQGEALLSGEAQMGFAVSLLDQQSRKASKPGAAEPGPASRLLITATDAHGKSYRKLFKLHPAPLTEPTVTRKPSTQERSSQAPWIPYGHQAHNASQRQAQQPWLHFIEGLYSPSGPLTGQTRLQFEVTGQACLLSVPEVYEPMPDPPTVMLITSDTHRYDHLSASGSAIPLQTPQLDQLAAEGICFHKTNSPANSTLPSHVSYFTGRSPIETGIHSNRLKLSQSAPTLAEAFAAAGFATSASVSLVLLGDEWSQLGQGFDSMSSPPERIFRSEEAIASVQAHWQEVEGRPYFCWLHVFDAHTPYQPPPEELASFWDMDRDPRDTSLPEPDFPSIPEHREVRLAEYGRALYRAEVAHLDRALQPILEHPRVRSGVTAFIADHGESLGEHDIWWNHSGLFPQTIHVPFLLRYPNGPRNLAVRRAVEPLNLGRTLLNLVDLTNAPFPGTDLRKHSEVDRLANPSSSEEAPQFSVHLGQACSISDGGWHLIMSTRGDPTTKGPRSLHNLQLFHLERDPECIREVARENTAVATQLRARLIQWTASQEPQHWQVTKQLTDHEQRQLAELGYTDSSSSSEALIPLDCRCKNCKKWSGLSGQ